MDDCPFRVGDILRIKPGCRLVNWRPDSNCEARSRLATVTKLNVKREVYPGNGNDLEVVVGICIRPEHRVKNVWVHPKEFCRFNVFDPMRANVYADYLEEAGEYSAAKMLRNSFPLGELADGNSTA